MPITCSPKINTNLSIISQGGWPHLSANGREDFEGALSPGLQGQGFRPPPDHLAGMDGAPLKWF
jgi:hypothetical protein